MRNMLISTSALLLLSVTAAFPQTTFTFTTFDPPGSTETIANGLNDSGEIVGFYLNSSGTPAGFIRSSTGVITSPIVISKSPTYLSDVNNQATISAFYYPPGKDESSLLIHHGSPATPYAFPGALGTQVNGLSNKGALTGIFVQSATLYPAFIHPVTGSDVSFSVTGAAATFGQSINNSGIVVGIWTPTIPYGVFNAFIRESNGTIISYDEPNAADTYFQHINECGTIVGFYITSDGASHGLYGKFGHFNTLDVPGSGGTSINGINNDGQITGLYSDSKGVNHGFLGTPASPTCTP